MRDMVDIDGGSMPSKMNNGASAGVSEIVPFGKEMRKQFMFAEEWRNLNHGSFGTYPRPIRARLQELQDLAEQKTDLYIRFTHVKLLGESRHLLAKFLNAPPSTIVLVANATTGINTVFHNMVFHPGDTILHFSTTYSSCVKILLSIAERTPAAITQIPLTTRAALSNAYILDAVESTVSAHRAAGLNPRALLLDTIVSNPGFRMPYEDLIALCRRLGIYSVVDGAHGVGQIPLDLSNLDPDFFVTNTHKWLFVPRACAVMYVPHRNQAMIRTTMPTSAGFIPNVPPGKIIPPANIGHPPPSLVIEAVKTAADDDNTPFVKMFEYVGTLNSQAYLCVKEAMRFREKVCGGEIETQRYVADLARKGADRVARILGTEVLDNKEGTLRTRLAMVNVRLPLDPEKIRKLSAAKNLAQPAAVVEAKAEAVEGAGANSAASAAEHLPEEEVYAHVCFWMQKIFIEEYASFVPVLFWGGAWWTRLSAQVYLDMDDFEWVAEKLQELCKRVKNGEHLRPE